MPRHVMPFVLYHVTPHCHGMACVMLFFLFITLPYSDGYASGSSVGACFCVCHGLCCCTVFPFATVAAAGIFSSTASAAFTFAFLHVQVVLYYTVLVGDVLYLFPVLFCLDAHGMAVPERIRP